MVAEHASPEPGTSRGGLQIHVTKLLLTSVIAAIASSVALIVAAIMIPPPPPPGPNGPPPPPPHTDVTFIILTGLFVLSWLAVVVVLSRDQILRRLRESPADSKEDATAGEQALVLLASLREELAQDRRAELAALEERIAAMTAEYGEQRETDGYVNGMRAARGHSGGAEVRPLHRVPPA